MDISSEMIHSLLPVFLVSTLGAGVFFVGLIEGVGEGATLVTRMFSGALSDWIRKRKALALVGYGLGALSKPLFALASGVGLVFTARCVDRIGKGVRGAPRDALVADVTSPEQRGAAYGLRQSLDSIGAFLGPTLAVVLMAITAESFRTVFWVAVIPGGIAVLILALGVREPTEKLQTLSRQPFRFSGLTTLGAAYWSVVVIGAIFGLARFSEAFLLLRAQDVGLRAGWVPLVLILMNAVYALTAYPAGRMSDRLGPRGMLVAGLGVLAVSDWVLGMTTAVWGVCTGAALWGFHMGLTQGVLNALVANTAEERLRGTAFGFFSLVQGVSVLGASLLAGGLWDRFGASIAFWTGGGLAVFAMLGVIVLGRIVRVQN